MAKKRGGLAGVWDRNKGVIKTVAPIAAGFIPGVGPLIGAGLGAAMRGLDRPGKGGIGLDLGGAVRGGLEGYGGAKLGQAAKGGLSKLFTAGQSIGAGTKTAAAGGGRSFAGDLPDITGLGSKTVTAMPAGLPPLMTPDMVSVPTSAAPNTFFGGASDAFGKASKFVDKNKTILSGVGKGIMGARQGDLDQQAADAMLEQRKYEFDKTYGLDAAQEADRKQREDDLMAQRAAFRTMFTGVPQAANIAPSGMGTPAMTMPDYMQSVRGPDVPSNTPGERYMMGYGSSPAARQVGANAQSAGMDYMATGFGGSARARQLAEEAAARGRKYTYGRQ